jgi:RNA polymerase sigma-70 factor (ECF subfamily)
MEERLAAPAAFMTAHGASDVADVAFEEMYRGAWRRVYSFVRCQVADRGTAQELAGRAFFKAYRHRRRLPAGPDALLWMLRIAHNLVIDHWRVEGRRAAVTISLDELGDVAGSVATPEATAVTRERRAALIQLIGDLDERDRSIIALKFGAQRTNREIARVLRISDAAVSMRLLRALRRLRARMVEAGV